VCLADEKASCSAAPPPTQAARRRLGDASAEALAEIEQAIEA
jgi:hypothetical protein